MITMQHTSPKIERKRKTERKKRLPNSSQKTRQKLDCFHRRPSNLLKMQNHRRINHPFRMVLYKPTARPFPLFSLSVVLFYNAVARNNSEVYVHNFFGTLPKLALRKTHSLSVSSKSISYELIGQCGHEKDIRWRLSESTLLSVPGWYVGATTLRNLLVWWFNNLWWVRPHSCSLSVRVSFWFHCSLYLIHKRK